MDKYNLVKIFKMDKYNLVKHFMQTAGQPTPEKPTKLTAERENLRHELIIEESNELITALLNFDRVEVLDALVDLEFVFIGKFIEKGVTPDVDSRYYEDIAFLNLKNSYTLEYITHAITNAIPYSDSLKSVSLIYDIAYILGFDKFTIDYAFRRVYDSNMSKFCTSLDEVDKTVKFYQEKDIATYHKEINGLFVVYRSSNDKVLKSINYKPVNLTDLV